MRRLTIRARLTLLWALLFLVAGTILLGLTYVLMRDNLNDRLQPVAFQFSSGPVGVAGTGGPPPADELGTLQRQAREFQEQTVRETLNSLLTRGSIALGVVGVVGMGFGWLMAERALRPLARVTETARRVAGRSLHERIALTGPSDEIKELADTVDSMLERLDHAFDGQRRFVANASHELRTPLAINRTLIEVALGRPDAPAELRHLGDTLLAVNRRHERLIDGLLTLASSEQGLTTHDPVDLAAVARHVLDQTSGPLLMPHLDPAPTVGDPVLLERVVQNLVENAVRYNVADGWVAVTTRATRAGVELTVANTGPVIAGYDVPALFEPFRRLRDRVGSSDGTGLGLSIVRSVAQAHGGTASAQPRDGGGLTVRVMLPTLKLTTGRS